MEKQTSAFLLFLAVVVILVLALAGCAKEEPVGAARERIAIDAREDSYVYNGADIVWYSDNHSTQKMSIDGATGNLDGEGTANFAGAVTLQSSLTVPTDTEHIGLPTIETAVVITTTDGALWTVADGEVWFVHNVFCNVTTNFDCTGDDCVLHIGDGNDEDGFLDLDDAELQTTDTEITGAQAGWQGMYTATSGAYLIGSSMTGFVYAPSGSAETIDIMIDDDSAGTNPTAGAATCYLVYTRVE